MSTVNRQEGTDERQPGFQVGNAWQGSFPNENTKVDGFVGLSPVTAFPPNALGVSPSLS